MHVSYWKVFKGCGLLLPFRACELTKQVVSGFHLCYHSFQMFLYGFLQRSVSDRLLEYKFRSAEYTGLRWSKIKTVS